MKSLSSLWLRMHAKLRPQYAIWFCFRRRKKAWCKIAIWSWVFRDWGDWNREDIINIPTMLIVFSVMLLWFVMITVKLVLTNDLVCFLTCQDANSITDWTMFDSNIATRTYSMSGVQLAWAERGGHQSVVGPIVMGLMSHNNVDCFII